MTKGGSTTKMCRESSIIESICKMLSIKLNPSYTFSGKVINCVIVTER